jgi:Peptidase A4 family
VADPGTLRPAMKRALRLGVSGVVVGCLLFAATGTAFGAPVSDLQRIGKDRSYSTNWSGYAVFNDTFTDAKGNWTVPAADCSSMKGQQLSVAAAFTGIDGYFSRTVEQTGTDTDCIGKTAYYYAWYEFYPAQAFFGDPGTYPVEPGDAMSAEVSESGGTVTTTLHNSGHSGSPKNWTYTGTAPSSGLALSSAQWILEAPTNRLTNFGTITFTGASANNTGLSSYSTSDQDAITMVKHRGTARATPNPSSPPTTGDSFSVDFNSP